MAQNERLKYTDVFDDPNLPGEMVTALSLEKVPSGTSLASVREGIPEMIPSDGCCLGWRQSLELLALLVEAEIPGIGGDAAVRGDAATIAVTGGNRQCTCSSDC